MSKSYKSEDESNHAAPHTIKKFELVEKYVDTWARKILSIPNSEGVVFIDCMCNNGIYYDDNGNYVEGTPIRVAKCLDRIIPNYERKKAVLYFNDLSEEKVLTLKAKLKEENICNVIIHFSFGDGNALLKSFNFIHYQHYNKLLFYDPYTASIDWEAVGPFTKKWSELIINHMVIDTSRGAIRASKPEVIKKYEATYQKEIDELIKIEKGPHAKKEFDNIIISIMKQWANGAHNEIYIASFPFYNRTNGLVYNLIHYSQHIKAFKLFKYTAWKTFEGRSSLKTEHNVEGQLCLTDTGSGYLSVAADEYSYNISNIAEYIYEKYAHSGEISFDTVYSDLDRHPIFPGDGYRNELRSILKQSYGVKIKRNSFVFDL